MKDYISIFIFFSFLGIISCGDAKKDISSYYFPIEELMNNGKVYEYRMADNDSIAPHYWYYIVLDTDSGKFLINNYYDYAYVNRQYVREEIVGNGVLASEYIFLQIDQEQQKSQALYAEITKNNAFPFSVNEDGGLFQMELTFKDPNDPKEDVRLIRSRKYIKDTIYTFQGKDLPAIRFDVYEKREFTHPEKGDFDKTTTREEIYAQGIGLVSNKYKIGDVNTEYVLKDIYSMDVLEKNAARYWGQPVNLNPVAPDR